ncbi:uncharacterized protein LOC118189328 [Stegodyphus dumicola]|uniref:uncharacterized protein LOC118189328 n=1 Tax=Stegodyphus dumicola TaxID=202533 RepID=UPI0015AC851A|nr:uncharacterized protein LOC118189328 [Stegodyphus dumicola]
MYTHEDTVSVLSLFINESAVADLWKLEAIGITDPPESFLKQDLLVATLYKKFLRTGFVKVLGIIEEVPLQDQVGLYLLHHPVIKHSSNTKIRPVFDASVHEKNFVSLNSCLEKGPNLLGLIPSIFLQFQLKRFRVTSDIRQAFLQINLIPQDRDYLRFLWYEDGDPNNLLIYRHCRLPFGVTSSPFLLGATIAYHLDNVEKETQETARKLKESFYVNNCVTSFDSFEEVEKFMNLAKRIMSDAKFELWD